MLTRTMGPHSGDEVRSVMRTPAVTLGPDTTLRAAARVLRTHDIGAIAIVATEGLIGVLSERDLVQSVAEGADPDRVSVRDAMTEAPHSIESDNPLWAAAMLMLRRGVRHLPVTNHGHVVGMLSIRDALAVIESDRIVEPHTGIDAVEGVPEWT